MRYLPLIIAVGVVLRVFSAWYQGGEVTALPGIFDQTSYHALAQRVVDDHGFTFSEGHWPATPAGEPTAHWSFLYTLYLAAVYSMIGVQPIVARLLQAAVGGFLHTWLTYRVGSRVFGPTVGAVAALVTSVYAYFVYYAGGLLTETFYFVGILWTLDVALRIGGRRRVTRVRDWAELGLAIGVTGLLRQVFLPFVPLLFLWLWWSLRSAADRPAGARADVRQVMTGAVVTLVIVTSLIVPWTIRNYRVFGAVVPLNTNAGFAFFWGNHPVHGTRFKPLLPNGSDRYAELIPGELRHLNEGLLDRALLDQALQEIRDDPARYLRLSVSRAQEYFKFWPSSDSSTLSNVARVSSFGLCLPLMLLGVMRSVLLVRQPEHSGQARGIVLLYLWIVTYTLIHLATWTLIRYRLPVDIVLVMFAALGMVFVVGRPRQPTAVVATN